MNSDNNPLLTADGSFTFYSEEFSEAFHSLFGAKQEALKKFIEPLQIAKQAEVKSEIQLLDICYGLGYNSAMALETIWSLNPHCQVDLIALELDQQVPKQAIVYEYNSHWLKPIPEFLQELAYNYQVNQPSLKAKLLIGDARVSLNQVVNSGFKADAIFLDPFSPPKCPQLWTVEFMKLISKCLKSNGKLATYSCAASVRTALKLNGLTIGSTPGVGRKSPGTIANFGNQELSPLSQQEQEHLLTAAAVPYRDPTLADTAEVIKQRRQAEQASCLLEPTSRWKKRWYGK